MLEYMLCWTLQKGTYVLEYKFCNVVIIGI